MGSQRPTFPLLPPPRPRPRILLGKFNIRIVGRVVLELVRELWRMGLGCGAHAGVRRVGHHRGHQIHRQHDEGFATSLSIIFSFFASVALFDFSITVPFVVGSNIVKLGATWFYNQPAAEKPREVVHEKLGGDEGSCTRVSLSSLSLKGSGPKSANVLGSPVDPNQPNLGDMNLKRKSLLPTSGSIATAVKGFISRSSSSSSNGQGGYFPVATGGVNGTPLDRTGSQASLYTSKPLSRNQSNAGPAMSGMAGSDGDRSSGCASSEMFASPARR